MIERPEGYQEAARIVGEMAVNIASHLYTKTWGTTGSQVLDYTEEKLQVSMNQVHGTITVSVKLKKTSAFDTVYFARRQRFHLPITLRSGKWIGRLAELNELANTIKVKGMTEKAKQNSAKYKAHYAPISDSHAFKTTIPEQLSVLTDA